VNAGEAGLVGEALRSFPGEVELCPMEDLEKTLGPLILERYGALGSGSVEQKLDLLAGFRILCAHRRGPLGVETVNAFAEAHLRRRGKLDATAQWYAGRPVIVTANDYQVGLFNGDIGVLAPRAEGLEEPMVAFFPGKEPVSPGRLPPHETVFAMSVHKSQGSEFDEVALLLPDRPSPILTRELVYTAVTRARRRVRIFGSAEVLSAAIEAHVQRASGLRAMLWG
jgi:exodeoxyribonuclease V alpha subunit